MSFVQEYQGLLPLLTGFVLIALAVFVFRTARGQSFNVAFSALYMLFGIKSVCDAFATNLGKILYAKAPEFPEPVLWAKLGFVCGAIALPIFLLFVLLFPRPATLLSRHPIIGLLIMLPSGVLIFQFFYLLQPAHVAGFEDFIDQFQFITLVVTFSCLAILAFNFSRTADPIERIRGLYVVFAFGVLVVLNLVVVVWYFLKKSDPSLEASFDIFAFWSSPIIELGVAGLIGFAIVKYQLLGVELKVKVGAKYIMVGTLMVVGFFLANNTFQKFVEPIFGFTEYSYLLSALAATLVFNPIQKGAGKLVNKMFPETTQPQDVYLNKRGQDIYHAQVAYILRDADISERERRFLDNLREQLKLDVVDAARIERDLRSSLGTSAMPPPPTSPPPRPTATPAVAKPSSAARIQRAKATPTTVTRAPSTLAGRPPAKRPATRAPTRASAPARPKKKTR